MDKDEYLLRTRECLHDPEGKIWSDDELAGMLHRAAEAYSRDSGMYRGRFRFMTSHDGSFRLPDDFVSFVAAWNSKGFQISAIGTDELSRFYGDYSAVEGDAEFCYEDFGDIGRMRLCPNPHRKQGVKCYYPASYGLVPLSGYGVPVHSQDYGIPVSVHRFRACGDAVYSRKERLEKIHDHAAIVYHAAYQAYTVDSEFQDTGKANFFLSQYRRRVARFGQIMANASGIRNGGRYY
jgi:hypothetical protein